MQPDAAALSACCVAAMSAINGHGRRWAVARCVRALQAPGVPPASPAIDEQAARAMLSVAEVINARVSS